ncbi:MAG: MotA/TolQ/ExbB proton channel family protein [bacterium]
MHMYRLLVVSAGFAWLGLTTSAWAQAKPPATAAAPAPASAPAPAARVETLSGLDIKNDAAEGGKGSKEEIEQNLRTEMGENAVGDNKQFTIHTADTLKDLAVGDLYKNEDTVFKIAQVQAKVPKGGTFVATRLMGMSEPQRRWVRISGKGPTRISSSVSLFDLYLQGGMFLHPIAFLFVVMVVLTVNGVLIYRRQRVCPDEYVVAAEEALLAGDLKKFEDLANTNTGLLAAMSRAMMIRFDSTSIDEMRSLTEGVATAHVYRMRIPIRALNLIAVAAPLLGLLGTIIGMVIVFEGVAGTSGAAKASVLASGIRVKLFSTATALIVAIPSLFIFFIFNQRLNLLIADCNNIAERFVQLLSRHKPKQAGEGRSRRSSGSGEAEEG